MHEWRIPVDVHRTYCAAGGRWSSPTRDCRPRAALTVPGTMLTARAKAAVLTRICGG
ncbi:hypothetical protein GCM10028832_35480 [Streptomyces sparsus]